MSACTFAIMHQHLYDRSCRPAGHCLRGAHGRDFVARLKPRPAKARSHVDSVTKELLFRAQVSAIQRLRRSRHGADSGAALYFVECDALALLQAHKVSELAEAANTLGRLHATLVLRLCDGFESLSLRDDQALFIESLCRIRESGARFALGAAGDLGGLVRLLQRMGFIDYLFLHLGGLPRCALSAAQAERLDQMRDLMIEQINANGIRFVASGMDTEQASELARFLPFTYWMGSSLSAQERI